jgi:hypothetical protein
MKRKAVIILVLIGLCLGKAWGISSSGKVELDPYGNPARFWIEENQLKVSRNALIPPRDLYSFTQEVNSFDVKLENNRIYLAWEKDGQVRFCRSEDSGQSFGPARSLEITGEVVSSPSLVMDDEQKGHLVFLSQDPDTGLNRVRYAKINANEPSSLEIRTLFESHDHLINLKIKNLPHSLLVFWQKEYLERRESYLAVSLDRGVNFGRARYFDLENDLLEMGFIDQKFCAITGSGTELKIKPVVFSLPQPPAIISPAKNATARSEGLQLWYTVPREAPLLCRIELSPDDTFPAHATRYYEQFISSASTEAVAYQLPQDLTDGTYFLRASFSDGLNSSTLSPSRRFTVDNLPPQLVTLEAERKKGGVLLKGKISESPAWLTVNGTQVSIEADLQFESPLGLEPGKNLFTLILSDEAGNTAISTREVLYDPAAPEIEALKPEDTDWFKPDSTILIQAKVADLQQDIEDSAQAALKLGDEILEDSLAYDPAEGMLSGFVTLPEVLSDGEHTVTISLVDRMGNEGKAEFKLRIDHTAPALSQASGKACFTNSLNRISLPVQEQGAGLDPSGTLIKISGVSLEGTISAEGENLVLVANTPLREGTYEAEIVLRDLVGNVGEPTVFCLAVDTTPPKLSLGGSYEAQTDKPRLMIEAEIEDKYPSSVKIYNNRKETASFDLAGNRFSREIELVPGNNDIMIEALDQAGNKTTANIFTFSSFQASGSLIDNFAYGPNPFSPVKDLPGAFSSQGKGMVFTYALSKLSDVKIYIFDLTGTLIWKKEINSTTTGITAWSGVDHFGQTASNGVYPYVFCVNAGGRNEMRKGRIIVYQ